MTKFIIYNKSGKRIGSELRKIVHRNGLWHKGIQVNIYFEDKILIQERSERCDIAWNRLDQSLATQQIIGDKEDDYKSIKRGIKNELGIRPSLLPLPKKVAGPYKLQKTYDYAPGIINNEFVSLYKIVLEKPIRFNINSKKVESIRWMDINELKTDIIRNPEKYTKTLSFWIKKNCI